jgi:molybdopterin synthase catalytic subunit
VDLAKFLAKLKKKSGEDCGMLLIHNGIVRNFSKNSGKLVKFINVKADREKLIKIIADTKRLPGIAAVEVEIREGRLEVGDDIMLLGLAGSTREYVIPALAFALDRIKKEVTVKQEFTN